MRTFEGNLDAYHALNGTVDLEVKEFTRRLLAATTPEERQHIQEESDQYFTKQSKIYEALGGEMAKIMSKRWWEFWK